jgi:hypothetical protein
MRGMGVLATLMSMEEMTPRRLSVTKSPRHDAIGGAILSESVKKGLAYMLDISPAPLSWVTPILSTYDNQKTHEGTEGNA